jgi:hypothetical protein
MTDPKPKPAVPAKPDPQAGVQAIQARNDQLKTLRTLAADKPHVLQLIDEAMADITMTLEEVQEKIKTALEDPAQEPIAGDRGAYAQPGMDEADQRRQAMTQATLARAGMDKPDLANPYRGLRLSEMARACLQASGASLTGKSGMDVIDAAMSRFPVLGAQTTSDFPILLENTLHKMLLSGYTLTPDSWSKFCKIGSVSDFKDWNRYKTGVLGDLQGVNEHGEYKNINIPDAEKESVSAKRHGAIISVTPEIILNDDLGAIQDLAVGLGRSAHRTVEKGVFSYLASNPTLSDGVALFHANHGNLATSGAVPSVAVIDAARVAMAKQKDVADEDYLDIRPALWLGPVSLGGSVREINDAQYDVDQGSTRTKNEYTPNRVRGLFKEIVDTPRLTSSAWYLFANPNEGYGILEVVFLDGQQEPRIVQEENFRTGGLSWRAELPFGVAAIDHRGAYMNPGA